MPLRRSAQITIVLGFLAVGVWLVRSKKEESSRKPAQVATKPASAIKPRSAAGIMQEPNKPSKYAGLTVREMFEHQDIYVIKNLDTAEVEAFLERHGRTTGNLLAASRLLHDLSFVREAVKADPDSPAAQLELAIRSNIPAEKSAATAAFSALAPGNSLGDYLTANLAFRSGDAAAAAAALARSMDSPLYAHYTAEISAAKEQAYRDAGYEPLTASAKAYMTTMFYEIHPVAQVSWDIMDLQDAFIHSADFDSAEPTVVIGLTIGQRLQGQGQWLEQNRGIGIEKMFLQQLDPYTQVGASGQTAGERLDELQIKEKENNFYAASWLLSEKLQAAEPATQARYFVIAKSQGDIAAGKWLSEQK
jgi:hypothetical protein